MTILLMAAIILTNCSSSPEPNKNSASAGNTPRPVSTVPTYTYEIVNTFPHDPKAFTQGLVVHNGVFYESTGQYEESTLRKVDIVSGKVIQQIKLGDDFFGEGMTIFGDKIYQITWREGTAFVYDLADMKPVKEFRYSGDGWGLTHDGTNLIMSDGTHILRFVDPETFQTVRTITVNREDGRPLMQLNELEYVNGEIWANIWHSENPATLGRPNHIARIDPASGKLLGYIDLSGISPDDQRRNSENTLNGIAYDDANDRIFVTGKQWSKLYEIRIKPKQ
jgi:glutaminyl-peptide cyclotransferase